MKTQHQFSNKAGKFSRRRFANVLMASFSLTLVSTIFRPHSPVAGSVRPISGVGGLANSSQGLILWNGWVLRQEDLE